MNIIRSATLCCITLCLVFSGPAPADDNDATKEDKVAKTQESLSQSVQKTAARLDNFFSNERHSWSANKTRVTLRGNFDWIDDNGWEFNPELRLFLALPGLNDRLRIVANDDDDGGATDGSANDQDESDIALRYIGKYTKNGGYSYDLGLSTRDDEFQGFVRLNMFRHYSLGSSWAGRSENRLYWYTSAGLRFRQNAFYPWLFYEVWPGAAWTEERDYEFTPAIRFRLEFVLGTPPKKAVLEE